MPLAMRSPRKRKRPEIHKIDNHRSKDSIDFLKNYGTSPIYCYVLVAAAAVAVFSNVFDAEFVYDDRPAIVKNGDVIAQNPLSQMLSHDFWGNPMSHSGSHKSYRPLTTLSFRLNFLATGLDPWSFHMTNIVLHALASCLVLRLSEQFIQSVEVRLLSALLFAVHPIHCEAVAGVVGRADVLCTIFVLMGILHFRNNRNVVVALVFATLAMLSKETGIMLLPILVVQQILSSPQNFSTVRRKYLQLSFVFALLSFARMQINGFTSPKFSSSDNPAASHPSIMVRTMTFLYLPMFHLQLLTLPRQLCFDWSMDAIPLVESVFDARLICSILAYGILGYAVLKLTRAIGLFESFTTESDYDHNANYVGHTNSSTSEREEKAARFLYAGAITVLPHILATNLLCYVGFVAAERILYLPSVGYCLNIGLVLQNVIERNPQLVRSIALAVIFIHAARTYQRNMDWKTEEALFAGATHIIPSKAYANLGHVYTLKGRLAEAEVSYLKALEHRPNMADTHYNLGVIYNDLGRKNDARVMYEKAVVLRKHFALAYSNLGLLLWEQGNKSEAETVFEACTIVSDDGMKSLRDQITAKTSCFYNLGRIYKDRGQYQEALKRFHDALNMSPTGYESLSSLYNSIGEALSGLNQNAEAELYYEKAILQNSQHLPAYLTMAHHLVRQNRSHEALTFFNRAKSISPASALVYHHTGIGKLHLGDLSGAELELRKALGYDANHAESVSALANVLREQKKFAEAEELFARLVELRPVASSYASYGAILHQNKKYSAAKDWYYKTLALNPSDHITKQNLEKLVRKMKTID